MLMLNPHTQHPMVLLLCAAAAAKPGETWNFLGLKTRREVTSLFQSADQDLRNPQRRTNQFLAEAGALIIQLDAVKEQQPLKHLMAQFLTDESGSTAVEYGLIIALIAIAVVGGITAIGTKTNTHFARASASMNN